MSVIVFATRTWDGFTSGRVPYYHMAQEKKLISKICIPRTSSLTSSYSAPASLHLRCNALQNATTSITSDGDAPKLISLSRFPLSFLKVEGSLNPHSSHLMRRSPGNVG
jgi:hypothetical protein